MLAVIAPGQGAQTAGFLRPWLDVPGVRDRLAWWSAVAGLDLVHAGTSADAATVRDTAVAQPLLVAAGLAGAQPLFPHLDPDAVVAGHSIGEVTAAALGGVLTPESALVLARERGRAMAAACNAEPTGMTAVLGGDESDVVAAVEARGLTVANRNGAGQLVAAGTSDRLEALEQEPPDGARLRRLAVAGAFHTRHMAAAADVLATVVRALPSTDPRVPLLSNADGAVVASGGELLDRLVRQVAQPVRWDLCMRTLADLGVTGIVELLPGGTLAGLVRRMLPDVACVALRTPDDLDAAQALVAAHARTLEPVPAWRLVVAPSAGTFRPDPAEPGQSLPAGRPVGRVLAHSGEHTVVAPYGGVVLEWLAADGDPVRPGQPLLRLHPEGGSA